MIKAIAISADAPILLHLETLSKKTNLLRLQKTFNTTAEAVRYLNRYPVDLIFLDTEKISIHKEDALKKIISDKVTILITPEPDDLPANYDIEVIDTLITPLTFGRLLRALNKAKTFLSRELENSPVTLTSQLQIRADFRLIKINTEDIILVEGLDDYLKIHLVNQRPVVARMTLKAITEKLPAEKFSRVHRSFVVSVDKIKGIQGKVISIADEEIPVSAGYESSFFERFGKGFQQQVFLPQT